MATTAPYAKTLTAINGGAPTAGFRTPVAGASTVQLSGESISGWQQAHWTLFGYPREYATPAGWTLGSGEIYYDGITPPLITLPAAATTWGRWLVRLIVNGGVKNGQAGHPDVTDETAGWEVLSPNLGLREIAAGEGTQVDAQRAWTDAAQRNAHSLEDGGGNGQGYKAVKTANATVTTVQTYAMPDASAVVVEFYAVAKAVGAAPMSFFGYRHVFARNGGAPTAVGVLENLGTRQNGTTWAADIVASGNNIITRITGQLATTIEWQTITKSLVVTDTTI